MHHPRTPITLDSVVEGVEVEDVPASRDVPSHHDGSGEDRSPVKETE